MSDDRRIRIFDTTLARRRAIAGLQHEPVREARAGPSAREARRGRDRGRLRDRERGRLRGGEGDRSREIGDVSVASLARTSREDVERAARALDAREAPAHPHLHRHQRHPPPAQAQDGPRAGARGGRSRGAAGARLRGRRRVLRRGRDAHRAGTTWCRCSASRSKAGATTLNVPDTVGYTHARRVRRADPLPARARAGRGRRDLQPALPQRPRPRRREQPGRRSRPARARSSAP